MNEIDLLDQIIATCTSNGAYGAEECPETLRSPPSEPVTTASRSLWSCSPRGISVWTTISHLRSARRPRGISVWTYGARSKTIHTG